MGKEWTLGPTMKYPEENCCACGKISKSMRKPLPPPRPGKPPPAPPAVGSDGGGDNSGAIIGGVIGGVLGLGLLALALILCLKKRSKLQKTPRPPPVTTETRTAPREYAANADPFPASSPPARSPGQMSWNADHGVWEPASGATSPSAPSQAAASDAGTELASAGALTYNPRKKVWERASASSPSASPAAPEVDVDIREALSDFDEEVLATLEANDVRMLSDAKLLSADDLKNLGFSLGVS